MPLFAFIFLLTLPTVILPPVIATEKTEAPLTWKDADFYCEASYTSALSHKDYDLIHLYTIVEKQCMNELGEYVTADDAHLSMDLEENCHWVVSGSVSMNPDKAHKKLAMGFMCEFKLPGGKVNEGFTISAWLDKQEDVAEVAHIVAYNQSLLQLAGGIDVNIHPDEFSPELTPLSISLKNIAVPIENKITSLAIDLFNIFLDVNEPVEGKQTPCELRTKSDEYETFTALNYEIVWEEGSGRDMNPTLYLPISISHILRPGGSVKLTCPSLKAYLKKNDRPLVWVLFPQYVAVLALIDGDRHDTARLLYGEWIPLGLGYDPWVLVLGITGVIVLFAVAVMLAHQFLLYRQNGENKFFNSYCSCCSPKARKRTKKTVKREQLTKNVGSYEQFLDNDTEGESIQLHR